MRLLTLRHTRPEAFLLSSGNCAAASPPLRGADCIHASDRLSFNGNNNPAAVLPDPHDRSRSSVLRQTPQIEMHYPPFLRDSSQPSAELNLANYLILKAIDTTF
jgi:hypothetical protein